MPFWRVSARSDAVNRLCRSVCSRTSRGQLGYAASCLSHHDRERRDGSDRRFLKLVSERCSRAAFGTASACASTAVEIVLRTTDRCRFVACSSLTDVYVIVYMAWQEVPSGDDGRRHGDRRKGRALEGRSATGREADDRRSRCDRSTASLPLARAHRGASLRGEGRRGAGGERKEQGQVAANAAAGPLRRIAGAGPHVRP